MAGFSYARFSPAALELVVATSLLAHADNAAAAKPEHLHDAIDALPPPAVRGRWNAAGAMTESVFSADLKAVLERALELTEGAVEPADLAAALAA